MQLVHLSDIAAAYNYQFDTQHLHPLNLFPPEKPTTNNTIENLFDYLPIPPTPKPKLKENNACLYN